MPNAIPALPSDKYAQKTAVMLRGVYLAFIVVASMTELGVSVLFRRLRFATENPDAAGRILASMLERMGPTFIKLAQVLSSRPDLIGDRIAVPLGRLRDHVSPLPAATIVKIIEESFGVPLSRVFTSFTKDPIATGSIAQVHLAVLEQGEVVVVKVQRPLLDAQMAGDFALLGYFGRWLERVPRFRRVPFRNLFREFEVPIRAQLDFEREARNSQRFQRNLGKRAFVRIPRVVPELCNPTVITMEYIENLIPVERLELSPEARRGAAEAGLEALYQMIFVDGLVHADLHAGNVFFRPNGDIVILDFGLIAILDDELRKQFREFFFAMATNHGSVCARIVLETAESVPPDFDARSYEAEMRKMVDRFSGIRVQEFEVAHFASALFDLQRRFSIRGSTAFTMTIVSLLLFEGILKTLDPELDFQREAAAFMRALQT